MLNYHWLMNSKQLQKQFKSNYENLYSSSDVVTSWYFWFSRFPTWLGHYTNRINIKSKIWLKSFVGLKKIQKWTIKFNDLDIFNLNKKIFEKESFDFINKDSAKVIDFIENLLLEKKLNFWLEINVLSEVSRGHGLWFSWTIFANLITSIFLIWALLSKELINDYNKFQSSDIFKEIELLTRKLEFISKNGNTWTWSLTTMTNLISPTIYFCEKDNNKNTLNDLENINYYFSNFPNKFDDISDIWDLPLDYAIIYTWVLGNTNRISQLKKTDKNIYKIYEDFFHNELSNVLDWTHHIENILKEKTFYDDIDDIWSLLSVETTYLLKQIFMFWDANQAIDNLIKNINKLNAISHIAEWSWQFLEDFKYTFQKNISNSNEILWIMPIYSGKRWWDFLITMKHGISRDTFKKTLIDLSVNYNNLASQYLSREDWTTSDWIRLEQFVSWWEFSEHVNKDKVVYLNNQWEKYMDDYGDIIKKEKTWFLLDSISWKIFLNWVKLTSKDIKSQSTTIELFDLLLQNLWEDTHNNQLSASTYASQQNQMLWKIVMPFVKLVEREYWEKLPLICKWSLRQFYVRLEQSNIRIWIIKKI